MGYTKPFQAECDNGLRQVVDWAGSILKIVALYMFDPGRRPMCHCNDLARSPTLLVGLQNAKSSLNWLQFADGCPCMPLPGCQ